MRNTLINMANGKFAFEEDELLISEKRLELICGENEVINGKFCLQSMLLAPIKGVLYTTNRRMSCRQNQFAGKKVEIEYCFDSKGLDNKTTIKGDVILETNVGEYNLPFVVTIVKQVADSSLGNIRNLFHFANLANSDFEQAYKLFVSKKFLQIDMEPSQKMYYKMLISSNPCREHLEEFLLAINKKKSVNIELDTREIKQVYEGEDFLIKLGIKKTGWGFFRADISCEADFISFEKDKIISSDFIVDELEFPVLIDGKKLHPGNNYARIIISGAGEDKYVNVVIDNPQNDEDELRKKRREIKEIRVKLCELYIKVRTHEIHNLSWVRDSKELVERWLSYEELDFVKLFQAHLWILEKKKKEADYILEKFKSNKFLKRQQPEIYAYLLYIEALKWQQQEFTANAVEEVKALYEMHPHSNKIFWVLLFLDDEIQNNQLKKYQMIHEQYVYGCRSPFIYLEALLLFKSDETVLSQLQTFEKKVLLFAGRRNLITEDIAKRVSMLSLTLKDYDRIFCDLLKELYDKFKLQEILEAVCSLLIKGGCRSEEDFKWYELGVNAQLKLNLLYEYYLYTIPMGKQELLPKQMIMYFTFNQNIDYKRKAYLYANISKYKDEIPVIYEKYEPYINQFALEQLLAGHITEELIYLYEMNMDFLLDNEKCCDILERLIFTCVIECSSDKMRRVVVGYEEIKKVETFAISDNKAYARIYTDSAYVAIEDMNGILHFESVDFNIKPLLNRAGITKYANKLNKNFWGILLNRYKKSGVVLEANGVEICRKLLKEEEITDDFRMEILSRLIVDASDHMDEERVCEYLKCLDFNIISNRMRGTYIEKMIIYGMYDEAFDYILEYGYEYINPKRLVKLCSRRIEENKIDDELVALCSYVYENKKYDEVMLKFLTDEYYGSTFDMITLWKAAKNFNVDAFKVGERVLAQMLYTGFMPGMTNDIFMDYCNSVPNEDLVNAYISYLSYQYVVNKQVVWDDFFVYLLRIWKQKDALMDTAKIALISWCSKKKKLTDLEAEFVRKELPELEKKGITFGFYKEAVKLAQLESKISEKIVVEHLANSDKKVYLNYRIIDEKNESLEFECDEMKAVLGAMFTKEIVLFYGETLQYYIVEKDEDGTETIACSGLLFSEPFENDVESGKYGWINEMCISRSLKDDISLQRLIKEYGEYEIIADKLFELRE